MKFLWVSVILSAFLGLSLSAFPSEIQKCKHGDGACIATAINYIFQEKAAKGISGLNLVPIDPLVIKAVDISQGSESPVNINLKFRNSDLSGVSTISAKKVTGFGKDIKGPHAIYVGGGLVSLTGKYEIQGRVLLLPISGAGDSNVTLVNPDFKLSFHGKPYEKNGKTHMKIENTKLEGKISKMHMYLADLFNGDKALGDNMNAFLNENWEDIFNELKGKIFEAFSQIFQAVMNNVFAKYPYDELFQQ